MRRILAVIAGCLILAACHLPTYGGKTEKYDIGCAMRLGTTTYKGWADGWHWYGCEYMGTDEATCWWNLEMDPRFTVDDRYAVCSHRANWAWGSRGFITDGH